VVLLDRLRRGRVCLVRGDHDVVQCLDLSSGGRAAGAFSWATPCGDLTMILLQ
jgi:hypothetical protein